MGTLVKVRIVFDKKSAPKYIHKKKIYTNYFKVIIFVVIFRALNIIFKVLDGKNVLSQMKQINRSYRRFCVNKYEIIINYYGLGLITFRFYH